jgi:MFS family permease
VLLAAALGALVLAFPLHSLALVLAGALLAGIGHGLGFLGAQADINRIAPPEARGEVTAAFYACTYLGVAVPVIGVGLLALPLSLFAAVTVFGVVIGGTALATAVWHLVVASPARPSAV